MSAYSLNIEFASSLRFPSYRQEGLCKSPCLGADRIFSFLALAWARLFGPNSLLEELINPFLESKYPFVLSDLFPSREADLLIPAFTKPASKSELTDLFFPALMPLSQFTGAKHYQDEASSQFFSFFENEGSLRLKARTHSFISAHCPANLPQKAAAPAFSRSSLSTIETPIEQLSYSALLELNNKDLLERMRLALSFMKEEGLGGLRSSGYGQISKLELLESNKTIQETADDESGSYLILSCCCPTERMLAELENCGGGQAQYRIGRQSGWIYDEHGRHTGIKKAESFHFETGSIFSFRPQGQMLDLSVQKDSIKFPSFRYGIPFTMRIPGKNQC